MLNFVIPEKTYPFTKENLELVFSDKRTLLKRSIKNGLIEIDNFLYSPTNKRICSAVVMVLGMIMFTSSIVNASILVTSATIGKGSILVLGATSGGGDLWGLWASVLKYTRMAAYVVFVYKSLETIIKGAIEENLENCWKKVIGYIIGFIGVKYVPTIFDAINGK